MTMQNPEKQFNQKKETDIFEYAKKSALSLSVMSAVMRAALRGMSIFSPSQSHDATSDPSAGPETEGEKSLV